MVDKIKRDTELNWKKAVNFIPKNKEVIIYDCENITKIKIGDGITKINDLKFTSDEVVPISKNSIVEDEILIVGDN